MIAINMEMPDNCYKCCLHNMKSVFDVSCAVTRKSVFHEFDTDSKPDWCPLIELKPCNSLYDAWRRSKDG